MKLLSEPQFITDKVACRFQKQLFVQSHSVIVSTINRVLFFAENWNLKVEAVTVLDRHMDGHPEGRTDGQTEGGMDGHPEGRTDRQTEGGMDGHPEGRTDRGRDGRTP